MNTFIEAVTMRRASRVCAAPIKWLGRAVAIALLPMMFAANACDPADIAGVYKHRYTNSSVTGETFEVEDVLEIVRLSSSSAYVKTRLNFYNGHMCGFAVVADVEDDALVYRSKPDDPMYPGQRCTLKVKVASSELVFEDQDQICRQASCGTRGGYDGVTIDRKTRRPIRYMKLLIDSADYNDALAEHARP